MSFESKIREIKNDFNLKDIEGVTFRSRSSNLTILNEDRLTRIFYSSGYNVHIEKDKVFLNDIAILKGIMPTNPIRRQDLLFAVSNSLYC